VPAPAQTRNQTRKEPNTQIERHKNQADRKGLGHECRKTVGEHRTWEFFGREPPILI
jgi:hypothetical protein